MRTYILLAIAFAAAAVASVAVVPRVEDVDSSSYRMMAQGEQACRPYASRVLHPAVVRGLSAAGISMPVAFAATTIASAVAFYVLLLVRMRRMRPTWKTFVLLVSPLWWVWGGNIYIQDMVAAAFAAVLFLAVDMASCAADGKSTCRRTGLILVALSLFLLQLTRESSAVFALTLAVLAWRGKDRRLALASVTAMVAGMAVVAWASRNANPNTNELNGFAYMVCKVVANGVRNFTGLIPWNDGYAAHLAFYYPDPPIWKCTLPTFLQWGNVHEIGVYSFMPWTVAKTFAVLLFYFPCVLPLLWRICREGRLKLLMHGGFMSLPLDVRLALVVGGVFWVMIPFGGTSLMRYAGYAWPLFWIALPHLNEKCKTSNVK